MCYIFEHCLSPWMHKRLVIIVHGIRNRSQLNSEQLLIGLGHPEVKHTSTSALAVVVMFILPEIVGDKDRTFAEIAGEDRHTERGCQS
jgi:hypothetical protein